MKPASSTRCPSSASSESRSSYDAYRCQARVRNARRTVTQLSEPACATVSPRTYRCQARVRGCDVSVTEILGKALDGERISDDEALALLESRDLVAVGRAANEIRNRRADPDRITFIIDRNLNYTNICHTDCDFCAFYRSPGDTREGYLLPKPVISKKNEWLAVMRHAHRLGMSTTATMMYGHVETLAERVEHMRRIRELQDETGGFRAFISWTFQNDGNRLAGKVAPEDMPTSFDYLLTQAVSRIYLDNVPHIQSSWVTQGMKIGQVALGFGADDMGSVMIEENVVSAAGTTHRTSTEELVHLIKALGKTPVQRDTLYREVKVWN